MEVGIGLFDPRVLIHCLSGFCTSFKYRAAKQNSSFPHEPALTPRSLQQWGNCPLLNYSVQKPRGHLPSSLFHYGILTLLYNHSLNPALVLDSSTVTVYEQVCCDLGTCWLRFLSPRGNCAEISDGWSPLLLAVNSFLLYYPSMSYKRNHFICVHNEKDIEKHHLE